MPSASFISQEAFLGHQQLGRNTMLSTTKSHDAIIDLFREVDARLNNIISINYIFSREKVHLARFRFISLNYTSMGNMRDDSFSFKELSDYCLAR